MDKLTFLTIATVVLIAAFIATVTGTPSDPEPRNDQQWLNKHNGFVSNTDRNPNIPVIFYGDSITEGWSWDGAPVFDRYYRNLGVANYGIGGDVTNNVLWRILNGEVRGLNPRCIVLKIGTNNWSGWGAAANAEGIATIVRTIRQLLPNTKILLLGILPRTGADQFQRITEINAIVSRLHDGFRIFYLDMFQQFSTSWGVVPGQYFYDGLHLTTAGYEKWAETMNPLFYQLIA